MEKKPLNLHQSSDEFRKIIAENPGMPIMFFASEDAYPGTSFFSSVLATARCIVGQYLNCETPKQSAEEGLLITDKDDLEEQLYDYYENCGECDDLTREQFQAFVEERIKEYDPYWTDCIMVYVDRYEG